MSEFEAEVKKAEKELEQGLVPAGGTENVADYEFLGGRDYESESACLQP